MPQSLLQRIIADLAAVNLDEVKSPEDKIGPGQTVIGELDEEHRRLYALMLQYEQEFKDALVAAEKTMEKTVKETDNINALKEATDRLNSRLDFLGDKLEMIRKLFWASLKERFAEQSVNAKGFGLVDGWQVYREEKVDCDCPVCRGGGGVQIVPIMMGGVSSLPETLKRIFERA